MLMKAFAAAKTKIVAEYTLVYAIGKMHKKLKSLSKVMKNLAQPWLAKRLMRDFVRDLIAKHAQLTLQSVLGKELNKFSSPLFEFIEPTYLTNS